MALLASNIDPEIKVAQLEQGVQSERTAPIWLPISLFESWDQTLH